MTPHLGNLIGWILSKTVYRPVVRIFPATHFVKRLIPSWAIGQTWGDHIFVRDDHRLNFGLINHEKVHVQQWHRYGWFGFGFAVRYLFGLIRYGYENHPLEKEARNQ